jgi:DnaJ-class molecular chaperone
MERRAEGGAPEAVIAMQTTWIKCYRCRGKGYERNEIEGSYPCVQCDGVGKVEVPDIESSYNNAPTDPHHGGQSWAGTMNCPLCGGFGCVDDDPEVRGSKVECPRCSGSGALKELRWVNCEVCGGSGEVERAPIVGPYEDPTPCGEICSACEGTGRDCVEVEPITMQDLDE